MTGIAHRRMIDRGPVFETGLDSVQIGVMSVHFFAKDVSASAATIAVALLTMLGAATPVAAQVQTVVEYGAKMKWDYGEYSSFFLTSLPDEIAALEAGAFDDCCGLIWERTGETFNVWSGPESGALPTCRFFNPTFYIEHFYTPYAAECAALQANANWHWQYEGIVFYLQVPDANGNCPVGTTILYRLYWGGGGAPAHRLTTSAATFNRMLAEGWVFEGDGRTFAFACVPSSTAPSTP
jgi:hypothetical protein